ncbi:MAG: methyltransferase domain-containing protein [Firmicutes bacterium]|jgi:SAM-dependent methyltransferase|nr:methyltransferase domain-containing protein [Bacillota bacterium]
MIRITELAQEQVSRVVRSGDLAVDATAGNGRDTLFLARLVGPGGRVFAFDIQERALRQSALLLGENELAERVTLIHAGHETMAAHIGGPVAAVMFNLGYLPGGDHAITTCPERTAAALAASLELLRPGGVVTLVLYPGHPPGKKEREALLEYCCSLDGAAWGVIQVRLLNRRGAPPELLVLKKFTDIS